MFTLKIVSCLLVVGPIVCGRLDVETSGTHGYGGGVMGGCTVYCVYGTVRCTDWYSPYRLYSL